MPFLLNTKNSFIIVDNKPRQGLFYQTFNSTGFSRPLQIQPSTSSCYTATLDPSNQLHVIAQNQRNQIIHYTYSEGHSHSTLLLDDSKDIYKFSNLILHSLDNSLHLFYTAVRPNTNTYSLVHQKIDSGSSPIDHLLTSFTPLLPLKSICQDNVVYLLFVTSQSDAYYLHCLTYSSSGASVAVLLSSEFPIVDFDVCLIDGTYHITYIQDIYGNYQLLYFDAKLTKPLILYTSSQLGSPCILSYLGYLWITYLDSGSLYILLSINSGLSFSSAARSSLQDNLYKYNYFSTGSSSLIASHIYAATFNRVRLAIVSSIDIDGIHPDLMANTELDLLLAGLSFRAQSTPTYSPIPQSTYSSSSSSLTTSLPEIANPTPYVSTPTDLNSNLKKEKANSVLSAAQAFMNEFNTFDAQPIYLNQEK